MTSGKRQFGEERRRDAAEQEHDADDPRRRDRDRAGGDRPEPLLLVTAVRVDVERVVQEVGTAGGEGEGDEGNDGVEDHGALAEDPGRGRRRDDEDVLDPLLGPGGPDQPGRERPRLGIRARIDPGGQRGRIGHRGILPVGSLGSIRMLDVLPGFGRGPGEHALGHDGRLVGHTRAVDVGPDGVEGRRIGLGLGRELREVRGQPELARTRRTRWRVPRACSAPPASAAISAANARAGAGLRWLGSPSYHPPNSRQMLRIDELGLVVDRTEVRPVEQTVRRPDGVDDLVERRAAFIIAIVSVWRCSSSIADSVSASRMRSAPRIGSPCPGRRISASSPAIVRSARAHSIA